MPTVQISFLGVCTIFQNLPSLVPPGVTVPKNRVVLVKNSLFLQQLSGIDPHHAKVQYTGTILGGAPLPPMAPGPDAYGLDGMTLSIESVTANESFAPSLGCLPSLQAQLDTEEELGPPAPFVYQPDQTRAAAFFDIPTGVSWNAYLMSTNPCCPTVPSISMLTVETAAPPVLRVERWDGSQPTRIALTVTNDVARVDVMNFAMGEGLVENNRDFLLNYLAAATWPLTSVTVPQTNLCTTPSPITYQIAGCGDAGPGCSNSNYP